jgi:phospholipid-binding lipoprotein MlaA
VKLKYYTALFCLFFTGYAFAQPADSDPYEPFNRSMYKFNEFVDNIFFKPVATVYQKVLPSFVRTGVSNVFSNIDMVPTVFNDALQGNSYNAGRDTWRFLINTTVGIGGLFDVARHLNLPLHHEDFGLTLVKWGYQDSSYLVLPFVGPGTIRDMLAKPVDYGTSIYPYIDDTSGYIIYGTEVINIRANLLQYDTVLKQAFDPYVFVRNAYLQKRKESSNGEVQDQGSSLAMSKE